MKQRKNIKINVNMFDDTKLKIIDAKPERDLIQYIWFRMITLAGKVDRDGELYLSKNIPYTVDTLAVEFNRSIKDIEIALNLLIELEMLGFSKDNVFTVINFSKHQSSSKRKSVSKEIENDIAHIRTESNKTDRCKEDKKVADIKSSKEIRQSNSNKNDDIKEQKIITDNALRIDGFKEKSSKEQLNIYNLKKYKNRNSTNKSRRSSKKNKCNNNIKCIDTGENSNEEFITFHDGEVPKINGDLIRMWDFKI